MTAREYTPRGPWALQVDEELTAADCEPNPLLDQPDARLRPDPWAAWACQRCGSVNAAGMPETCNGCGMRNFGRAS